MLNVYSQHKAKVSNGTRVFPRSSYNFFCLQPHVHQGRHECTGWMHFIRNYFHIRIGNYFSSGCLFLFHRAGYTFAYTEGKITVSRCRRFTMSGRIWDRGPLTGRECKFCQSSGIKSCSVLFSWFLTILLTSGKGAVRENHFNIGHPDDWSRNL